MFVGILFLQIYKESPILGIKSYQNDGCLDSGTFEQSLGSTRMSFKRTNDAYKSLSQVWFQRSYRARGLKWRSSVVLHDSLCGGER